MTKNPGYDRGIAELVLVHRYVEYKYNSLITCKQKDQKQTQPKKEIPGLGVEHLVFTN